MKLSNQQISALAKNIADEIKAPIGEFNKQVLNSVEYLEFDKIDKTCIELKLLFLGNSSKQVNSLINSMCNQLRNDHFESILLRSPDFGYDNHKIQNDIILKTIEVENLQELIESIKLKYLG